MSEGSENWLGTLIFIVTFIGLFVLLLGLMPSEFIFSSPYSPGVPVPDDFTSAEMGGIKWWVQLNVTESVWNPITFNFEDKYGDNNTYIFRVFFIVMSSSVSTIEVQHTYWNLGPIYAWDNMQLQNEDDEILYYSEAETLWASNLNASKVYPVWCNHARVTMWVTDPNSTRNDLNEAWNTDGELEIMLGMGFQEGEGALSGWQLVGALLSFQAPQILGLTGIAATILNYAIGIPIWAMIAYLVYRLALLVIPFLGG